MATSMQDLVRQLLAANRLAEAAHVLETKLIVGDDPQTRLMLADVYIRLKEGRYRALARDHLERLVTGDAPPAVIGDALQALVWRCYFAAGPIAKIRPLLERHRTHFTPEAARDIEARLSEVDRYLAVDGSAKRRSSLSLDVGDLDNPELALRAYIFNEFVAQLEDRQLGGPYFTFGSCFAGNVARVMKAAGVAIDSFFVGEEVNTTFSNLNLLRFILGEEIDHADYYRTLIAEPDRVRLGAALRQAENVIYTLGVAPAFFAGGVHYTPHSPANLRSLLKGDFVHRFSTVDENAAQLLAMAELLKRHTNVRNVFLTVSPVPLAASLSSASTAVDDSESKAILRAAAGAVCREAPDLFTYFPSFEAFRWLPCFQDAAAFGAEDGSLRHVNGDLVETVVGIFMQATRAAETSAAQASTAQTSASQ